MRKIPLAVKLLFTAYMAVFTTVYWYLYGPTNFLYLCNVALFLTLIGMWTEKSLPMSMAALGITVPSLVWIVDFASHFNGAPLIGMTSYMFDESGTYFLRSLGLFHFWLPPLVIWLVIRLGYDSRAAVGWIATAWVFLVVCYLWTPASAVEAIDPKKPSNINLAFGLTGRQTRMPGIAWLGLLMLLQALAVAVPMHCFLRRFAGPASIPRSGLLPRPRSSRSEPVRQTA